MYSSQNIVWHYWGRLRCSCLGSAAAAAPQKALPTIQAAPSCRRDPSSCCHSCHSWSQLTSCHRCFLQMTAPPLFLRLFLPNVPTNLSHQHYPLKATLLIQKNKIFNEASKTFSSSLPLCPHCQRQRVWLIAPSLFLSPCNSA